MLQRVQGEPAGTLRRVIPQTPGDVAMAQLMQRYADERRHHREKNAENIGEIKAFPDIPHDADDAHSSHLSLMVYFTKKRCKKQEQSALELRSAQKL